MVLALYRFACVFFQRLWQVRCHLFHIAGSSHASLFIQGLRRLSVLARQIGLPLEVTGGGIADLAIAACWSDTFLERIAHRQKRGRAGAEQAAVVRQGGEVAGIGWAATGILKSVVGCDTLGQSRSGG